MAKIDPVLVIGYEKIGTIPLDQWKQAIWDDIEALRNEFGISYVTNSKLIVRGHQRVWRSSRDKAAIDWRNRQAPRYALLSPGLPRLPFIGRGAGS